MRIKMTHTAIKQYQALPAAIQKKARKQFGYLLEDFRHPSLNVKKYGGVNNLWQGRIDKQYRFYFHIIEPEYCIVSVIRHP